MKYLGRQLAQSICDGELVTVPNSMRRFWICTFVAFLLFRITLADFWMAESRFFLRWQRVDAYAALIAVFSLSAVLYAAYVVVGKLGKVGRIARDACFVAGALFYLKVAAVEVCLEVAPAWLSWALNIVLLAIMALFCFRRDRVVRTVDATCLVLSPIIVIYFSILITAAPVSERIELERSHPRGMSGERPIKKILIFLFDAMSYHRTFDGGIDAEEYPNLARAAERACVFENAYSPGNSTVISIPGIFCGEVGRYSFGTSRPCLVIDGVKRDIAKLPNLFEDMQTKGYWTAVYTYSVPYGAFFSRGIDHFEIRGGNRTAGKNSLLLAGKLYQKMLLTRFGKFLQEDTKDRITDHKESLRQEQEWQVWLHKTAHRRIRDDRNVVAFIHYKVPHWPYMFEREGPKDVAGVEVKSGMEWDGPGYLDNLRFADTIIGELLDTLESQPDADQTLVIITGDHSVRADPLLDALDAREACHVPLIVRLPGQTESRVIETPFSLAGLKDVLARVVSAENLSTDEFVRFCAEHAEVECAIDPYFEW